MLLLVYTNHICLCRQSKMNECMKDLFLLLFNDYKPVFRDEIVIIIRRIVIIMDISMTHYP